MKVQVEISVYPLKASSLAEPIDQFCRILTEKGFDVRTESMASFIAGPSEAVFTAVQEAFETVAGKYDLVMQLKVSNACPQNK